MTEIYLMKKLNVFESYIAEKNINNAIPMYLPLCQCSHFTAFPSYQLLWCFWTSSTVYKHFCNMLIEFGDDKLSWHSKVDASFCYIFIDKYGTKFLHFNYHLCHISLSRKVTKFGE